MRSFLVAAAMVSLAHAAQAGPIEDLAPGQWYEVPGSHLSVADPCPDRNCSYSGTGGQATVILAWGGGAFDTTRDRLIVWGGGHGDYGGNEVYAFDLGTLTWSRLSNPSDPPAVDQPYAADGNPSARHTYDYIQYVPQLDALCSFGGAAFFGNGQSGTNHTDCFSLASNTWSARADDQALGSPINSFSAVDSATGHVFVHGSGTYSSLAEYAPETDVWTPHGSLFTENAITYAGETAAIAPPQHMFVAVGGGFSAAWDIAQAGEYSGTVLTTQGPQDVVNAPAPGFVYDTKNQLFVGWAGGTHVYSLDPTTLTWTDHPPSASNTVTPTPPTGPGTYGRFAYSPAKNVFVVVNSTNENVFIYRLSEGAGPPGDGADPGGRDGIADDSDSGCGCRTAGSGDALAMLVVVGVWVCGRRRRGSLR